MGPRIPVGRNTDLRLSCATSDAMIDEGVGRIQRFLAAR